MSNARLPLAFAADTMIPPRTHFFLQTWGTSRFRTPVHTQVRRVGA
jgi:hypothetical protein